MKVYEYARCTTCKKALKFLDDHGVKYEKLPIADQPPSLDELKKMLKLVKDRGGSIRSLFNTSGILYREMNLAQELPSLSEAEALKLLAKHGKLIKRPFVLGKDFGLLGFRESEWKQNLL